MKRREFIALLGGAGTLPFCVLVAIAENDPEAPRRISALRGGLQERGWVNNIHLETRFSAGSGERHLIITSAAHRRLPAVYPYRYFVTSGGLASYGVDTVALYRQSASYIDRILKGERPAELPVQQPTKFEIVINLNIANALNLDISPAVLARADEVIE